MIRKLKQFSTIVLTIVGFAIACNFASCTPNPCKDVVCNNNGTCREGKCICPSGYEGPFCSSALSDKFIGYYDGFVRKNGDFPTSLTLIVAPGVNPTDLIIYDFYKTYFLLNAKATVKDVVKFDMPLQQTAAPVTSYRGNGYVETDKYIYMWYETVGPNGVLETYYYEGTKRLKP